jgi:Transcriptional regulators containing a DNA-binding HTH domain and an aminotransferase domain (MocR family) and their eukaryotic orthologs
MRSRKALPVDIELDRESPVSLRDQLVAKLVRTIDSLLLPPGTRMPSTRTVAEALGVSRSVAVAGYDLLLARGYLEVRASSGTYIAARPTGRMGSPPVPPTSPGPAPAAPPPITSPAVASPPAVDLRPGRPFLDGFPLAAWRSAWRHAAHRAPTGSPPDLGLPGLRKELRRYLETSRWQSLTGAEVVVVADLSRAAQVLAALASTGQIPDDLAALIVPDGARGRSPVPWRERTDGYLVDLGSFTAFFGADLPLAYLVVPAELVGRVGQLLAELDARPPSIAQEVLRQLLAGGVVERRVTALHRQREAARGTVARAFAEVPDAAVTGPTPDGAVAVRLPPGSDPAEFAAAAQAHGVLVSTGTNGSILIDISQVDDVSARRSLRILGAVAAAGRRRSLV